MHLPGLVTVRPDQTETIAQLADIVGLAFLDEPWSRAWLSALDEIGGTEERKLAISRAIIRYNFTFGAPYETCYMLPDMTAGAGGYRASELNGRIWNDIEDESTEALMKEFLTEEEAVALAKRAEDLAKVTNFKWMLERAGSNDFVHFYALGVDPKARGTGAFRKLFTPFLDYADTHGMPCYLECYSDRLEGLYGSFGFETVERLGDSAFDIVERAMVRTPRG